MMNWKESTTKWFQIQNMGHNPSCLYKKILAGNLCCSPSPPHFVAEIWRWMGGSGIHVLGQMKAFPDQLLINEPLNYWKRMLPQRNTVVFAVDEIDWLWPCLNPEGRKFRSDHMETIHLLEVFGGVGALARGMREKGLLAEIFDIRQSKFDNIHTESGLMRLCKLLSSVLPSPKGICVIEPTCSSWGWVNRGTSLRSVDPCFQSAWNGVWGIARPCQDNF